MTGRAELNGKGYNRWRSGHPWIFKDQVGHLDCRQGELAEVYGPEGRFLGTAFVSKASKITLRRFSFGPLEDDLEKTVLARIQLALEKRKALEDKTDAMRLVYSEADGLPGLIIDKYGEVLVLQTLTAAMDAFLGIFTEFLGRVFSPPMILARNDPGVRTLEGLPQRVEVLAGEKIEEVEICEHGLHFTVNPFRGQKTGFFLDQREARRMVREKAQSRRVLDLCCYQGGFTLNALEGGCSEVISIDTSIDALEKLERDAEKNSLTPVHTIRDNVFKILPDMARSGDKFDLIILDPPAFAKSRHEVEGAKRGYGELNRRCMQMLSPGGLLLTCSCSYNMKEPDFLKVLRSAAAQAGRADLTYRKLPPTTDHPLLLSLPESDYLKAFLVGVGKCSLD